MSTAPIDPTRPIIASGTFALGDRTVHRLGYGAMQITGSGVWGPPRDHDGAIRVLRRAVELGVDFVDTADSYGPYVSEDLIREALHPYDHVLIATKAGLVRTGPGQWHPLGRPEYQRQQCEMSLRRLGLECIELFQLHRIDPNVPADEQFGLFKELQDEGKIANFGLSEVTVAEVEAARSVLPVATVQNLYNVGNRQSEAVLAHCETEGIGFIPWFPLASGNLVEPGGAVADVATEAGGTPGQVALAWLLHRSRVMLPIPGTSKVAHLEENCAAPLVELSDDQFAKLNAAA